MIFFFVVVIVKGESADVHVVTGETRPHRKKINKNKDSQMVYSAINQLFNSSVSRHCLFKIAAMMIEVP